MRTSPLQQDKVPSFHVDSTRQNKKTPATRNLLFEPRAKEAIPGLLEDLYYKMQQEYPELEVKLQRLQLGPSTGCQT